MIHREKVIETCNGIIGLAIGDAMGVPFEFIGREKLLQNIITEMAGYGSHGMPKGTWSDDTSMTLATIDSIISIGTIDTIDIAKRFIAWMKEAQYTPAGRLFGIGRTTLQALGKCVRNAEEAESAGGCRETDNGNGSLMRILPIAYYCHAKNCDNGKILETVRKVSSITHRHEISIMGCYIYVLLAIELLNGADKEAAYKKIQETDFSVFNPSAISKYDRIIKTDISRCTLEEISSSGYIVSTLEAVLWVLFNTATYNDAIVKAINLGDDTDTVGACVGGLAGIIYGLENIKPSWRKDLIKYDYIMEMCMKLDSVLYH